MVLAWVTTEGAASFAGVALDEADELPEFSC